MGLLIKGGHLLDPATGRDGVFDLLVEDGVIKRVEEKIEDKIGNGNYEVLDAAGKYVMPGFVDLHVHLREPGGEYKETIRTGTLAAARGGFTTVCPMPNTNPVTDSGERVTQLLERASKDAAVTVCPVGAVTLGQMGEEAADIRGMVQAGAVAISEDGKSVMNTRLYLEGMKAAREAGIPVFAHCEDKLLAGSGVLNAGAKARELGLEGISNGVEDMIAARDIIMAKEAGVRLHLCHCSTRDSVALVRLAKEWGQDVTAEVCPHHFTMTDEDIPGDDANYKMNPPLRGKEDVRALKEGLRDNIMDVIATDHAPHSREEKDRSMKEAPFGITGLETAFSLAVTELVDQGYLTKLQLAEKLARNPAGVIGIDRGSLEIGKAADIVIADFDCEWVIDRNRFASKGRNTPFHGKRVRGRVEKTYVAGKLVYDWRSE